MSSSRVLISIPEELNERMKAAIPEGKRSKTIAELIEQEVSNREEQLRLCALAVEQDSALNDEMSDWDNTISDGLDDETW